MAQLTLLRGLGRALALLLLIVGIPASASEEHSAPPPCDSDVQAVKSGFAAFWTDFRSNALRADYQSLEASVRFPLSSAGVTDSDQKVKIDQNEFRHFFESFLSQDSGRRAEFYSVRDFLRDTSCVPSGVVDTDGASAQLGPMAFRRIKSRWQLTEVFATSD
jgi:hypothetical protein